MPLDFFAPEWLNTIMIIAVLLMGLGMVYNKKFWLWSTNIWLFKMTLELFVPIVGQIREGVPLGNLQYDVLASEHLTKMLLYFAIAIICLTLGGHMQKTTN